MVFFTEETYISFTGNLRILLNDQDLHEKASNNSIFWWILRENLESKHRKLLYFYNGKFYNFMRHQAIISAAAASASGGVDFLNLSLREKYISGCFPAWYNDSELEWWHKLQPREEKCLSPNRNITQKTFH